MLLLKAVQDEQNSASNAVPVSIPTTETTDDLHRLL